MLDEIKRAQREDLDAVCEFYKTVCLRQSDDDYVPGWYWGVYPNREQLQAAIEQHEIIIGRVGGQIAGAGRLTVGEEYQNVKWQFPVPDNQVGVLHLYSVHPDFRGRGIASAVMQGILDQARRAGLTVVHLDVRKGNVPAEKLYEKNGFSFVAEQVFDYENIGDTLARIGECRL